MTSRYELHDLGDLANEDEADIIQRLPGLLRSRCCTNESWAGPDPAKDHGHTNCWFMGLAAREIERLRRDLAAEQDNVTDLLAYKDRLVAERDAVVARAERAEAVVVAALRCREIIAIDVDANLRAEIKGDASSDLLDEAINDLWAALDAVAARTEADQ